MPHLSGRCACGAITWQSPGPVLWAGHCHCESCRRVSSAPITSFFGVPRQSVEWTGEAVVRRSSAGNERGHCGACGSPLFFRSGRWPDESHLYAATLDDPRHFKPEAHFHWAERMPWLIVADDLPKYPGSADTTEPVG